MSGIESLRRLSGKRSDHESADPTRCRYCGITLLYEEDLGVNSSLDTGEPHIAESCREYLFAEVERMREVIRLAGIALELSTTNYVGDIQTVCAAKLAVARIREESQDR